jgi:hypothetical protein
LEHVAAFTKGNEGDVEEAEKFQDFIVTKVYLLMVVDCISFADMSMNVVHLTHL